MRIFNIVNVDYSKDRLKEFCINNYNSISASIKSIVTQVRSNNDNIERLDKGVTLQAWTTANRPTTTPNTVTMGVNLTTGNINYTTDGGTTWKNYDGTAA